LSLYFLKVHNVEGKKIVAVCDEEILGNVYREGDVVLDVSPVFYGGKRVDLEEVVKAIEEADMAIITGKRIVKELEKRGLVLSEFALKVQDQLHIHIIKELEEGT